jgi:hypothetical protein
LHGSRAERRRKIRKHNTGEARIPGVSQHTIERTTLRSVISGKGRWKRTGIHNLM